MTIIETSTLLHKGKDNHGPLIRSAPKGSLRAITVGGEPGIQLQILRYNTVDSYGSVWLPGCLTDGLNARLPQLAWGHDWSDVIGRAVSWQDTASGPVVDFRLDDFDAVPRARQAYAQVQSGTIDDCSIGFAWGYESHRPSAEELQRWPGCTEVMERADTDETSLVLRGAVPGAKVVGYRSRGQRSRLLGLRSPQMIDAESAARILTQFAADVERGEADLFTALEQVKAKAVPGDLAGVSSEDDAAVAQTEIPEVTDPAEGDRETTDAPVDGAVTPDTEIAAETADIAAIEPIHDTELDQTMAEIDDLLAEREAI